MKKLVLSIDAGTSSFRIALFDFSGKMIEGSLSRESYSLETDSTGRATLSTEAILTAFDRCLALTLDSLKNSPEIKIEAAGISFFWHSLLGLNAKNDPITPVITWADGRPHSAASLLRKKWNEETYHRATGCMIRSAFWPAKLAWLRKNQPALWKKVSLWISPAELILNAMTGKIHLSHSMAAGTGLYSQREKKWSPQWIKSLHLKPKSLPKISNEGSLTLPSLVQKYPVLEGTLWFAGIGDGAASNLGLGATDEKIVAINFGTSAAIRLLTSTLPQKIPFGLFCYRLDHQRLLIGGAISNAGIVRAWFEREYGLPAPSTSSQKISTLWSLPYLTPERAPTWPEELPGMTLGFNLESSKEDLYNSMIDATFFRLNRIRQILQKWSGKKLTYRLGGGIAEIETMVQKFSDMLASTIAVVDESEASIRGAAIYSLELLGVTPPAPREIKRYTPNLKRANLYQKKSHQQAILESEYREFFRRCQKRGLKFNEDQRV